MRIRNLLAGTTLAGAMLVAGAAHAQYSAVARADLNIRSGPGQQFPVVGIIGRNDTATVIDCAGESRWCEVQHRGLTGWSAAGYLVPVSQNLGASVGAQAGLNQTVPPGSAVVRTYPEAGAVAGGAGGAVVGALVGGPVGAVVGGAVGAGLGAANPPAEVRSYVLTNRIAPVALETNVTIGASLPSYAYVRPVPGYAYDYAYVNDRAVLIDPGTRRIVYIYR